MTTMLRANVEAYSTLFKTLRRLRALVRQELERVFGKEWEAQAVPSQVRQLLDERRVREGKVSWHMSATEDPLSYAGFVDLHEIIAINQKLDAYFSRMASDPGMLRTRFVELDMILERIAYARPLGERDAELLAGFEERLTQLGSAPITAPDEMGEQPAAPVAPPPAEPRTEDAPAPPRRLLSASPPAVKPAALAGLESALARENDSEILAALFQEITVVAERIWTDASAVYVPVWEKARESRWYENRFAPLGLVAVSDFYELVRAALERVANGASLTDLHEFLKERDFARILLRLRELFLPFQSAITANQPGART